MIVYRLNTNVNYMLFHLFFPFASKCFFCYLCTNFLLIGSYSPEVRDFGTLITSTKVFRHILCKNACEFQDELGDILK